jgi:hypothetical protein
MALPRRFALATVAVVGAMAAVAALIQPGALQDARGTRTAAGAPVSARVPAPAAAASAIPATAPASARPRAGAPGRTSAGSAGMVVAIDPETGMLGAPTPGQRHELRAAASRPVAVGEPGGEPGPEPLEVRHADGSYSATLDSRYMEYTVVRIGPDGRPITACVQGARAAESLAADSLSRPAAAREAR